MEIDFGRAPVTSEERSWRGCTFVADDASLGNFLNAQFGSTVGPGHCGTIDDDNLPHICLWVAWIPEHQ